MNDTIDVLQKWIGLLNDSVDGYWKAKAERDSHAIEDYAKAIQRDNEDLARIKARLIEDGFTLQTVGNPLTCEQLPDHEYEYRPQLMATGSYAKMACEIWARKAVSND